MRGCFIVGAIQRLHESNGLFPVADALERQLAILFFCH